jgi:chromosomal replication initiation ATPase DnaA
MAKRSLIDHPKLAIWRESAIHFHVDPLELTSKSKSMNYVDARHSFWQILRDAGMTYKAIGEFTGHDHKTVMNGCSQVRREELKLHIKQIKKAVLNGS